MRSAEVLSVVSAAAVGCWLMLALIHCFKREGIVRFVLMARGPHGWLTCPRALWKECKENGGSECEHDF